MRSVLSQMTPTFPNPFACCGIIVLSLVLIIISPFSMAAESVSSAHAEGNKASYSALADLLENPVTRASLIEQLRKLADAEHDASKASHGSEAPVKQLSGASDDLGVEADSDSLPSQVATLTQEFAESLRGDLAEAGAQLKQLASGKGMTNVTASQWANALVRLAIVIVVLVVSLHILRRLAATFYRRVNRWATRYVHKPDTPPSPSAEGIVPDEEQGKENAGDDAEQSSSEQEQQKKRDHIAVNALYGRLGAVVGTLLIDIICVALACAIGYAASLPITGGKHGLALLMSFFTEAFAAVELSKALVRTVFASHYPSLRLIGINDRSAAYWTRVICRLISISAYSLMVLVPLSRAMFSPAIGQMLNLIIMLGVFVNAITVILRNRSKVSDYLKIRAQQSTLTSLSRFAWIMARAWHVLAILYFTVLLVVSQLAPDKALSFMGVATAQTVLAVVVGLLLSTLATVMLGRHITLSESWRTRLPKLEKRLNGYAPIALRLIRIVLSICFFAVVLDAWHVVAIRSLLHSSTGMVVISAVGHVALVLLIAVLLWTLLASIIEHRLSGSNGSAPSAREQTLLQLLRNAMMIAIVTMTLLIVLSQVGINIAPLIAGAGVVGLAIGFGAQKLVQDIITGIFIQLENGMNQNDVVEAAGVFGTVERLTIRSVGIRTMDGGYHLIPFSSVTTVTNHMRDFSYHLGEYTIGYRESVDDAMSHLRAAFDELMKDPILAPEIIDDISIPGVVSLNEKGVTIRVLIKTTPGMQWAVQRGYNRLVKSHFNAANIEMPYPQSVIHFAQDKNGDATPLRTTQVDLETYAKGHAPAPGQTPRQRRRASQNQDVLGNEHETGEQGRSPHDQDDETESKE